jgi:predicted PurR-regulated permease PerM
MAVPLLAFAGSAGVGMLKFIVAVALSGLMLPFGPRLLDAMQRVQARLLPDRNEDLAALAGVTIRSVAQGVIGVAALQAVLAGIGLKVAGIPSAGVLAFGVLILCILQIGAAVILVPVVIWVWTSKDFTFTPALVLTIYLTVVGFADNVLKPIVMGRGLSTPVMVIFVGVLGGTLAHGIVGLFVGPIVLAVAWQLAMAWIRQDKTGAATDAVEVERQPEPIAPPTGSTVT